MRPGALKDTAGYGANPYQWMQDTLLPAMRARGITSEQRHPPGDGRTLFGNRTASSLFSLMFLQQEKIAKNMKLSQGAMGTDDLVKLARSSPQGAEMALGKAWENLKIAVGRGPDPAHHPRPEQAGGCAPRRRPVGLRASQRMFDSLIYGFAGLSAALAVQRDRARTLKAAFLGLEPADAFVGGHDYHVGRAGTRRP